MRWAKRAIEIGIVLAVALWAAVVVWGFVDWSDAKVAADRAATRYYDYDRLENAAIKEELKQDKATLQGMATRKKTALRGDAFQFAGIIFVLGLAYAPIFMFSLHDKAGIRRKKAPHQLFHYPGAEDEIDDDRRMRQ